MDRLAQTAKRLAGLLLVCAVVFAAARFSLSGSGDRLPLVIALGLIVYLGLRAWRTTRRFFPRRTPRAVRPPALPGRAHWLSPRNLRRGGRL
jgi:hypothetical protein